VNYRNVRLPGHNCASCSVGARVFAFDTKASDAVWRICLWKTLIESGHVVRCDYDTIRSSAVNKDEQEAIVMQIRRNVPDFPKWGPRSQVRGHATWSKKVTLNFWDRVSYSCSIGRRLRRTV